jgi:hypothetical protein
LGTVGTTFRTYPTSTAFPEFASLYRQAGRAEMPTFNPRDGRAAALRRVSAGR